MTRDNYAALQSKIEKEIIRLQKQAQALQAKRRAPVIASIVRDMREYGITPEELASALGKKASKTPARKTAPAASKEKRVVPPKYRHPDTGETWTGRGKPPRWITEAETGGKSRETFLIVAA